MPRILEIVIVCLMLGVALPLAGAAALLVWADLGRPLLFRQIRAGRGGRPITLSKFRSMHERTDAGGRPLSDAERVSRIGRVLRRTRLDEIPQLLSILRGDLALVGPRPLLPGTVAGFGAEGERRCRVRPGLTGWAQVSGNTRLGDAEKLSLDLWYVGHRGTVLDLRILWMTARVILTGERRVEDRIVMARDWRAPGARSGTGEPL